MFFCFLNIFLYFLDLNTMQLHVRGQGNHVVECEGTETVGQIKVSYLLYFYLPATILLLDVLSSTFSWNIQILI